ncbi:hypothetical protein [Pseudomonas sp. S3E12]|uniref:hypothetical protein n=1 Tax=Pseudomonas sp. S3E12 TaxID=1873126 RepID=UPI00081BD286|nr:hypothetical protein [Pseudomonas sp. S3E12]OCW26606.1 hypothetical protein BB029_08165 [Pseudomonas sp. S3E12]
MPSALSPLAKPSHQLLYLIYGRQDVYRREAKFSILTALSQLKPGESLCIRVMTDRPQDYIGWPVETIALDEQTLAQWQGENGYPHRRKACAIAQGLMLADKTLFVDTDTLFLKSPHRVFELIEPGQYVMDGFEYDWSYVCKRPDYLKLGEHLQAHGISADNSFKLYNSGLCGVRASDAPLLEASIRLIDEWTRNSFDIHTIEQIAISFAMRDQKVREAHKFVHHYFADKRFFHAMQAHFFTLHGEAFGPELVARCRDVPRVKPVPSPWQRLRIKWKLRNQRKHLKKVGRDLLYGSSAPAHPYYDVCRHGWWESASREIRGWDEAEQKRFFGAKNSGWPKHLPRPARRADEKTIIAFLRQRMTH